jgi:uncharacterized membrane protein YfcA
VPDALGWSVLAAAALIASTVGGVAGFGAGVIMIPVIAWVLGVKAAVPVLTVAMFMGNLARVWFSRREVVGGVVLAFLVGAIPSAIGGALLYSRIEGEWISRILGGFMLASVPLRRWLVHHGVHIRLGHFPLIGAVFGGLSAMVGSVGPLMTPFFLGHGLRRGAYVATDALCTVGMYVARGIVFRTHDLLAGPTVAVGVGIGLVMIAGAWAGRRILDRVSDVAFLRVLEVLLVAFGLQMLFWPTH